MNDMCAAVGHAFHPGTGICMRPQCDENGIGLTKIGHVGPDAPIVTAPNGGQQSHSPYRFDLVDARAMFTLARILDYGGRRYTPNNWRLLSVDDHLNHAAEHLFAALAGDTQDDHLGHLFCRAMMALAVAIEQGYEPKQGDERE